MSFTVHDIDQRSDAWRDLRLGRLTSSRANDMLATVQKGEAAARRNLRVQLVLERVTGRPQERQFTSAAMQHGVDTEDAAVGAYELLSGNIIMRTGFLCHDSLMCGCSLDGHYGDFEGIIEIKCPIPATHLDYVTTGKVPTEYLRQVTHALWMTGAQWCDWMSFEPSFPDGLQAKIVRISRSDVDIAAYELAARLFLEEVDAAAQKVRSLMPKAVA